VAHTICRTLLAVVILLGNTAPIGAQGGRLLETTGSIRGRVTAAATGAPIRGAEVRVQNAGGGAQIVTTDAEGYYEVRDLLTGMAWSVHATKSGYLRQEYGQSRPFVRGRDIQLEQRERATADIVMTRAGAIAGRIFDEFGDPVAAARVQVLRSRMEEGARVLVPLDIEDTTDDTGAYRIYALPPGEYYVSAAVRASLAQHRPPNEPPAAVSFYPGTPSITDAQRIVLGAGEEQTNVAFSLPSIRGVRIAGMVVGPTGSIANHTAVELLSGTTMNVIKRPLGNFGMSNDDGTFTFGNVQPGSYLLRAEVIAPGRAATTALALLPIVVGSEDLTGLVLTARRGSRLSVSVSPDVTSRPLPPELRSGITVVGMPPTADLVLGIEGPANGNGETFTVFGPVAVDMAGLPPGWMIKSIEFNGAEVSGPVEVSGENGQVRVVLTDRVTELRGAVTRESEPAPDAAVLVFPDDSAKWRYPSRFVHVTRADATGRFTMPKLPAEDRYLAIALEYIEEGEEQDVEFLERIKPRATGLSIGDAERKAIALSIVRR
jgi:hypothetical protein